LASDGDEPSSSIIRLFMNLVSGHDVIESIYRVDTTGRSMECAMLHTGYITECALSDGRYREMSCVLCIETLRLILHAFLGVS
jgi:hypothetical protein